MLIVIHHVHGRMGSPSFLELLLKIPFVFDMSLFWLLAGFSTGFESSSKKESSGGYIRKRAERLIVPYVTMSIFYLVIQWVAQPFVSFKRPVDLKLFLSILVDPYHAPMGPLWFLYVLFEVTILYLGMRFILRSTWLCLALSVILAHFVWPTSFGIEKIFEFLPIFLFGRLCYEHSVLEKWNPWAGLVLTSLAFSFFGSYAVEFVPQTELRLLHILAGCFATIYAVRILQDHQWHHFLMWLGRYSMAIYLLHMLIITLGFHFSRLFGMPLVSMGLMFLGALLLPIPLVKYGIGRSVLLTRLVLGSPVRN